MKTVLVADDEAHMTYILSFKLERSGLRVLTAGDGQEAHAIALAQRPDLVITDFQMPRMSGLELSMALWADPATRQIPVLMLTARGHRITEEELVRTGIRRILAKPFSTHELLGWVNKLLEAPDPVAAESLGVPPASAA
jgi:two-component system phosphate regulon response regulator PhoB